MSISKDSLGFLRIPHEDNWRLCFVFKRLLMKLHLNKPTAAAAAATTAVQPASLIMTYDVLNISIFQYWNV